MNLSPDALRNALAFYRLENQRSEETWLHEQATLGFVIASFYVLGCLSLALYDYVLTIVCAVMAVAFQCGLRWRERLQERGRDTYKELNLALLRDLQAAVDRERNSVCVLGENER